MLLLFCLRAIYCLKVCNFFIRLQSLIKKIFRHIKEWQQQHQQQQHRQHSNLDYVDSNESTNSGNFTDSNDNWCKGNNDIFNHNTNNSIKKNNKNDNDVGNNNLGYADSNDNTDHNNNNSDNNTNNNNDVNNLRYADRFQKKYDFFCGWLQRYEEQFGKVTKRWLARPFKNAIRGLGVRHSTEVAFKLPTQPSWVCIWLIELIFIWEPAVLKICLVLAQLKKKQTVTINNVTIRNLLFRPNGRWLFGSNSFLWKLETNPPPMFRIKIRCTASSNFVKHGEKLISDCIIKLPGTT